MLENGKGPLSFLPGVAVLGGESEPPKVTGSWPLNEQTITDPRAAISISFSRDMNKTFTESAVSLRSSQASISGSYSWIGSTLYFQPSVALAEPGIYTLTVSKSQAEDAIGKNLTEDFILRFNYNADTIEPTLLGSFPSNGAIGVQTNSRITLRFSKPMNVNLVLTEVTTNPSIPFNLPATIVSPDRTTFEFVPVQPLTFGTTYSVTVPNSIKDSIGNALLQTYRIGFTVGDDFVQPALIGIRSTTVTDFLLNEFIPVDNFEKTDQFVVDFSEPIQPSTLLTGITFNPSAPFTITENSGGTNRSFIIQPNSNLAANQTYQIQVTNSIKDTQGNSLVKTYTYNANVNGPRSQFLFVRGIYLNTALTLRLQDGIISTITHDGGVGPTYNYNSAGTKAFHVVFCRGASSTSCLDTDLNLVLMSVQFSVNFDFGPNSGSPYLLLPQIGGAANIYKTSIFNLTESPNTYIFTVKGGTDGVKDTYNNYMQNDYSVRFQAVP
ncbi:Ig-like protein [Leptospira gomenensis]|uniref:Ig-like protein n=2 Tax=Leptospira gomenensis TaxID=2484974 RepID=A0A5F1YC40_9LEPT|nr:Ig-like protein [Leptospira gomenensis]TGK37200.1 Ig-like protein [Leptospira gomenensis]TGK48879.1 Ig-like protein [Leptospira gomenensis]TGK64645.1 Ig-like protein [Leptospira gomenensis]